MAKYSEVDAPEGDLRGRIMETLANGNPFVLLVASDDADDPNGFRLKMEVGGGIDDNETVRRLLEKTLAALP